MTDLEFWENVYLAVARKADVNTYTTAACTDNCQAMADQALKLRNKKMKALHQEMEHKRNCLARLGNFA